MVVEFWKLLLVLRGVSGKVLSDIAYDGEINRWTLLMARCFKEEWIMIRRREIRI